MKRAKQKALSLIQKILNKRKITLLQVKMPGGRAKKANPGYGFKYYNLGNVKKIC